MQNQCNSLITFDNQLKTALNLVLKGWDHTEEANSSQQFFCEQPGGLCESSLVSILTLGESLNPRRFIGHFFNVVVYFKYFHF